MNFKTQEGIIMEEKIEARDLLQEIKLAIKDLFVAKMHQSGDEVSLTFSNGQRFILTLWEEKPKNA